MCCIFTTIQLLLMANHVYLHCWSFVSFGGEEEKAGKGQCWIVLETGIYKRKQAECGSVWVSYFSGYFFMWAYSLHFKFIVTYLLCISCSNEFTVAAVCSLPYICNWTPTPWYSRRAAEGTRRYLTWSLKVIMPLKGHFVELNSDVQLENKY